MGLPSKRLQAALDRLDELKVRFAAKDRRSVERQLTQLARRRFADAAQLIRFHEILLFLRAYPHSPAVLEQSETLLATFHQRVERLHEISDADLARFSEMEFSGIAGTELSVNWGYEIARHLAACHPETVEIDWQLFDNEALLVALLKDFLPLFEDGGYVEYPIPFLSYLRAAKPEKQSDLAWLLQRFAELPMSERARAALYDGLKIYLRWRLGNSEATRSRMRWRGAAIFYQESPLVSRREVSLAQELGATPPLAIARLSKEDGERLLRMGRDTMAARCRELHGFSYGDGRQVRRVAAGRGVEFFIWGVVPRWRLPLLGYHAALLVKNEVPIGYAESLSLFERAEFGLNLFYTFREGESAWIYARLLGVFQQLLGVTVYSIDPYQIGFHNEEAIAAGAFWFYRKLGFRPVKAEIAALVEREERRLAARSGYRTAKATLRKLAAGHLLYEAPTAPRPGDWDDFHLRNLGLRVQQRLAEEFGGDEEKMRRRAVASVSRALNTSADAWQGSARRAFEKLALLLAMTPDLSHWSAAEKALLVRIIRAKAGSDEARYVRLLQKHASLRDFVRRL